MVRLVTGVAILLLFGTAEAEPRRGKPGAPLALELVERSVPGGREVTLVAVARRDVPSIELELGGKAVAFGASAIGQRRELTVVVAGDAEVRASARAGAHRMSRVSRGGGAPTTARPVPRQTTLRTLPDGRVVREVRP